MQDHLSDPLGVGVLWNISTRTASPFYAEVAAAI